MGTIAPEPHARVPYTAVSAVTGAPPLGVRETTPTGSPKPRLLDRVRSPYGRVTGAGAPRRRMSHGPTRTSLTGGRDPDHSEEEDREITTGRSTRQHVLFVAHVAREGRVCFISAQRATRQEQKQYEEGTGEATR
jgi:hypothetical protein